MSLTGPVVPPEAPRAAFSWLKNSQPYSRMIVEEGSYSQTIRLRVLTSDARST